MPEEQVHYEGGHTKAEDIINVIGNMVMCCNIVLADEFSSIGSEFNVNVNINITREAGGNKIQITLGSHLPDKTTREMVERVHAILQDHYCL